jgi:hypothetical protein
MLGRMTTDWGRLVISQLEFYWDVHLRPRLEGLTDEEYRWEPVPGSWSVRPDGNGGFRLDQGRPEPSPPPVTTLAWRIVHVATAMSTRTHTFFHRAGTGDMFHPSHLPATLPGTAADALAFLDQHYREWHEAITGLDAAGLDRPLGPRGGMFAGDPMGALIVHINREVMHHGGEICLLRDLYRAGFTAAGAPAASPSAGS